MRRLRNAARKLELLRLQMGRRDPGVDRVPRLFGDLKLDRALGLLLHDNRTGDDMTALDHIVDAKPQQIAATQLTVDGEVTMRVPEFDDPVAAESGWPRSLSTSEGVSDR